MCWAGQACIFAEHGIPGAMCRVQWGFKAMFKIVRLLQGHKTSTIRTVREKNGETTSSEDARQRRWQEYFADLFKGEVIGSVTVAATKFCKSGMGP